MDMADEMYFVEMVQETEGPLPLEEPTECTKKYSNGGAPFGGTKLMVKKTVMAEEPPPLEEPRFSLG